jgi:hypothetical protein
MKCSICTHPRRQEIDEDLQVMSPQKVADKYGISFSSTYRHKTKMHHLATGRPEDSHERVLRIVRQVEKLIGDAEQEGTLEARTSAIRAGTPALRLLAQISGDLRALVPVSRIDCRKLEDSPEFRIFLSRLVSILAEYPGASQKVLSLIES